MKKVAISLIAFMVIGVGFLSGCNEQTSTQTDDEKDSISDYNQTFDNENDLEFISWVENTSAEITSDLHEIVDAMEMNLFELMKLRCRKFGDKMDDYHTIAILFDVSSKYETAQDEYYLAILNWWYYANLAEKAADWAINESYSSADATYENAREYLYEASSHFGVAAFIIHNS